jgi:hypothetical protein
MGRPGCLAVLDPRQGGVPQRLAHFLHLFYRLRTSFLHEYQELVLLQPESAVNQALKEAFLALRRALQAGE